MQALIETQGERATEGILTFAERSEYEGLFNASDFIAILKIKARRHLDQLSR